MPDWSRRRALAALGTGTVGVGGYWYATDDHCLDRREPSWTMDGRRWSPPAIAESRGGAVVSEAYGFTSRDSVYRIAMLDTFDGSPEWVFTERGAGGGVPLVADGTVYVGTGRDRVYALDRRTGRVEWRYDAGGNEIFGGGAWGRPAKTDDRVVVGVSHSNRSDPTPSHDDAFTHRVVGLDPASGEEIWERFVDAKVWTGPVAMGGVVVAATEAGSVYGFDAETGRRRWDGEVGTGIRQSLFADDDRVYVASEEGRVVALDPQGTEEWTASLSGTTATERDDASLLVGTDAGEVVALSRSSGEPNWRFRTDAAIGAISSDGSLTYVLDQRGRVHVLDAEAGERTQRFRVAENSYEDRCGWNPDAERASGLVATDESLLVTGPWIGRVPRYRE